MGCHHQKCGEEGPGRLTLASAPIAANESAMIVIMDRPWNQSWFPCIDARATPQAATMRRWRPTVNRGGCIVILL
jgi:hypothetical protein